MKLKNKKTGEIGYPYFQNWKEITCVIVDENAKQIAEYTSLAELNAEWEDYEEPKDYWYVSCDGRALKATTDEDDYNEKHIAGHKEIGNYFETKEEAEKAVRRLKAWKRLKDKGFRFVRIAEQNEDHRVGQYIEFEMAYHFAPDARQIGQDLDLLFGGGE